MGIFDRYFRPSADSTPSTTPHSGAPRPDPVSQVKRYHAITKHAPGHYARGPHALDWETQPDPFRSYSGAERIELPLDSATQAPTFDEAAGEGGTPSCPLNESNLSSLLQFSLGLSAWKQYGDSRWALRINPSSGNLHPTEAYLVSGPVPGWQESGFVAHYAVREHALEVRARLNAATWERITEGMPAGVFFVGLSSILWREEWKYGERAYRYCQHDVGHAIAAIAYSASCLGWKVRMLDHLSSSDLEQVLGLGGFGDAEPEEADTLLAIYPGDVDAMRELSTEALQLFANLSWSGQANQLSSDHLEWDAIHACAFVASKPSTVPAKSLQRPSQPPTNERSLAARTLFAGRRSAVAMDGKTSMSLLAFLTIMERCLPTAGRVPFASFPWSPRVHLLVFVHRVEGLQPGLYALLRESESGERLLANLGQGERVAEAPEHLPLYRIKPGSFQSMSASVSCDQAIAGQGTFSLGMVADFDRSLDELGAWFYPRLFWETGLIGQTLYLESEAAGLRGTGIGCFYDDSVHQLAGLSGSSFQSLYHFTVGGPVEDSRIQGHPPYSRS
ncbi:MAG: SagB-type dehydrogenase family enzyme [Candidatus Paceibacteria bacterium]|jgi:SagB-type dehydrogenase family enzyme